jgi:heme/copper-type cytochrome/quinol oxidase subunit 3
MTVRFVHDASILPDHAFDTRSLTWWGVLGYIAIEGVAFALALAAYFFLRNQEMQWPPSALAPGLLWGSVTVGLLLLSEIPNVLLGRAARAENVIAVRRWFIVAGIACFLILTSRALEFANLNIGWDRNAYGSIIWALLLIHTVHLITDFYETMVLTALMHTRHGDEGRRFVDTTEEVFYWHFIVLAWIPIYIVIYWLPRL